MTPGFRRDRRGRGIRGPLVRTPARPSVRQRHFTAALEEAVDRLRDLVGELTLGSFRVAVTSTVAPPQEVPASSDGHLLASTSVVYGPESDMVTIVVHRMPLLARTPRPELLHDAVYESLLYRWADLTGQHAEELDPDAFGD